MYILNLNSGLQHVYRDYNAILIPVAGFIRWRELLRLPTPYLASPWCRCPPTERTLWNPATKATVRRFAPETLHTLDPWLLSFPALSAGAYTTTLLVMEAVVSWWKLSGCSLLVYPSKIFSASKLKRPFFMMVYKSLLTYVFTTFCLILNKMCGRKSATWEGMHSPFIWRRNPTKTLGFLLPWISPAFSLVFCFLPHPSHF